MNPVLTLGSGEPYRGGRRSKLELVILAALPDICALDFERLLASFLLAFFGAITIRELVAHSKSDCLRFC